MKSRKGEIYMLKKLTITAIAFTALALPQAFALPVVPEAGISIGTGTKEQYAEAKVLPRTTIGYKRADRDQYGNQNDIYAKYNVIGSNVQLLGGWRNNIGHQSNSASFYGGIGVAAPHILGIQPYATYVKGSHFSEAQAGINYNIALGWGLNVNYHNYMPEDGDNEHGVGAGVTFHF